MSAKELFHNIPLHIPCLPAEVHPHFHQPPAIQHIRNQITSLINLLQGIFGTAVQLELKDVNGIFCLHHGIGTTTRTAHFRLYELTQQSEDDIKDGLIVAFGIVAQFVGNACCLLYTSPSPRD